MERVSRDGECGDLGSSVRVWLRHRRLRGGVVMVCRGRLRVRCLRVRCLRASLSFLTQLQNRLLQR